MYKITKFLLATHCNSIKLYIIITCYPHRLPITINKPFCRALFSLSNISAPPPPFFCACVSLSVSLSLSSFSLCPSSSGLPRSHLSHLQWKHPNLQMLSINHLRSNYNPINLCFHAPCCRTASTPPYSITLLRETQTERRSRRESEEQSEI